MKKISTSAIILLGLGSIMLIISIFFRYIPFITAVRELFNPSVLNLILIAGIMFDLVGIMNLASHSKSIESKSIDEISNQMRNSINRENEMQTPKTCEYCGGKIPVGESTCRNCGAKITK